MNRENGLSAEKRSTAWLFVVIILVALAVIILWLLLGRNNNSNRSSAPSPKPSAQSAQINSLVSYVLPSGWTKVDCSDVLSLVVPSGRSKPSCSGNIEDWPIKVTIGAHNITDCSQIHVNNQQVTNHVCASAFINEQKVIKSSTTFNDKSPYGRPTKVTDDYFGKGQRVVQFEYIDNLTSDKDNYQAQFDQLVNSVKAR